MLIHKCDSCGRELDYETQLIVIVENIGAIDSASYSAKTAANTLRDFLLIADLLSRYKAYNYKKEPGRCDMRRAPALGLS
jgi:hypothetical protein